MKRKIFMQSIQYFRLFFLLFHSILCKTVEMLAFGSLAIVCMDATWWPGGREVVGNQELHPMVWPVAWVLCLSKEDQDKIFNYLNILIISQDELKKNHLS